MDVQDMSPETEESSLSFGGLNFECQFCEVSFASESAYTSHMDVHQTRFEYPHSCGVCERRFVCREELQLHSRLHSSSTINLQPYKCKICDEPFVLARSLEYHLRSHGGIRVFRCQLCPRGPHAEFCDLSSLHEHLKDHQMDRVEVPPLPPPTALSAAAELEQDVSMAEAVYPELELLTQGDEGEQEVDDDDDGDAPEELLAVKSEPIQVGGARVTDVQKTKATAGAQQHSTKSEESTVTIPPPPPLLLPVNGGGDGACAGDLDEEAIFARAVNVKKTFCNLCNKKMATRKSLNTHYKSVHMKNAHTCTVCRTSFLFSKLLEQHTKKRKRIIPCEFCDLRFCSNKRWSSHIQRHQEGSVMSTTTGAISHGQVMYPRAVPITSSSSRPMTVTNAQQNQQTSAAIATLNTNNQSNNGNNPRQSLLKNSLLFSSNVAKSSASLLMMNHVNTQPTVNLGVNLTEGGNTIGKFPCDSCGKIFLSLNYLQAHLVKRRNPNFQFQCDVCEHRFSKKVILEEHKAYHERQPKRVPKLVIPKNRVQNGVNGGGEAKQSAAGGAENKISNVQTNVPGGGGAAAAGSEEEMDFDRHIIRLSDTSFKCNCCHRTFKAVNHLKCHLRYTHMKKSFKCRSCSQQFPYYKLYLAHMKHSKLCERCDKRICAKFDFKIHTQKCRGTAKLRNSTGNMVQAKAPLSLLNSSVPSAVVEIKDDEDEDEEMDDVILDENGISGAPSSFPAQLHSSLLLPATAPNETFPSIPHFLMDDLLLMDESGTAASSSAAEEFRCDSCDKSFSKMTSLHMHSFQHDPNKEMKCIFCNFLFLQRSSLNRHYRCRNTLHTCLVCKASFCSHLNLKQHICPSGGDEQQHQQRIERGNGVGGGVTETMSNGDFDQSTSESSELLSRKRNRSGEAVALHRISMAVNSEDVSGRDENIELSDTEPDPDMRCMMCPDDGNPLVFSTKGDLDQHVAQEHGTSTKCPICCKSFRSATILHIHMAARSSGKNKIECPSCPHRFHKQGEFRKHFVFHTMREKHPEMSDEAIYSRIGSSK